MLVASACLEERLGLRLERDSTKVSRICNARHRTDIYSSPSPSISSGAGPRLCQRLLRSLLPSHSFLTDCTFLPLMHGL